MLVPLASLRFGGPSITTRNPVIAGDAVIGRPVWHPRTLLAQLELRLGLPQREVEEVVRVQSWSAAMSTLDRREMRFYWRSYSSDPLGTAKTLLEWRDELVLAGWSGESVLGGGPRLDVFSELEASANLSGVAPGLPDRLLAVTHELERARIPVFEWLELAEDRMLWPELWRRAFSRLEACGVPVETVRAALPGATRRGDLAVAQSVLWGERPESTELVGDGSLVWLEAETSWELGQAVAALLRAESEPSAVVVRAGDVHALDAALAQQGLASQGILSRSSWRPALQVLPLSLELAFEPRDPQRVFELVTLPEGPFAGAVGRELAKALAEMPGLGGRPWLAAKQRLRDAKVDDLQLRRIAEWFEAPTHDPARGAPTAVLKAITRRVSDWLESELARAYAALSDTSPNTTLEQRVQVLGAAVGQGRAFEHALEHDGRAALRLVELRQVLQEVSGGSRAVHVAVENAGRIDHVARPAAVHAARDVVVWWYCVGGTEWQPKLPPWRENERRALSSGGVHFVDLRAMLAAEGQSWLAPVFAARTRLILAVPRSARGVVLAPHPILDELAARLPKSALEHIRVHVRDWLHTNGTAKCSALRLDAGAIAAGAALPLAMAREEWLINSACVPGVVSYSASGLEALASCPLKWALRHAAGLYPARNRSIPSGPMLSGKLGHRLIEELHAEAALADPVRAEERAPALIDRLISEEAGVLLCSGQRTELVQLKAQLCTAVAALSAWIVASSLDVIGVETEVRASWRGKELTGRVDLLLADENGREIVVDLKWGSHRYAELLKNGMALQLAIYARVRQLSQASSERPRSGYFCLGSATPLMGEGSELARDGATAGTTQPNTWRRLEATAELVERQLGAGRVAVTGVTRSLPLWGGADAPANDLNDYLPFERGAACAYCDYPAICGRSWEEYA